jgi:hypothetical protein
VCQFAAYQLEKAPLSRRTFAGPKPILKDFAGALKRERFWPSTSAFTEVEIASCSTHVRSGALLCVALACAMAPE